jgi:hypothetical protein
MLLMGTVGVMGAAFVCVYKNRLIATQRELSMLFFVLAFVGIASAVVAAVLPRRLARLVDNFNDPLVALLTASRPRPAAPLPYDDTTLKSRVSAMEVRFGEVEASNSNIVSLVNTFNELLNTTHALVVDIRNEVAANRAARIQDEHSSKNGDAEYDAQSWTDGFRPPVRRHRAVVSKTGKVVS